jgi:hypothetical protein
MSLRGRVPLPGPMVALYLLSSAIDALAGVAFAAEGATGRAVAVFLCLHALGTATGAYALFRTLPKPLRAAPGSALAFLATFLFFVPGLGLPALGLGLLLPMLLPRRRVVEAAVQATEIPDLPYRALIVTSQPIYGAVGLIGVVRHGHDASARVRAVMATRQLNDKVAIPILRVALRDPVDDVRLLAYALLDSKERTIYANIKKIEAGLPQAPSATHGNFHGRIAHQYWELVYLGLAQGEVLAHVLGKGLEHAERATTALPEDAGLRLLQGRLLMARDRLDDARVAFDRAEALGLPRERLLAYRADLAFYARRFDEVQTLLRALPTEAKSRMPLSAVVDYWSAR